MGKFFESVKSLGGTALGVVFSLIAIFSLFFLLSGGVSLGYNILPFLFKISSYILAINIFLLLPFSFFNKTQPISSFGFYVSSFVFGATAWFWGLVLTYYYWGLFAVIIGLMFFGIGVAPLALLATMFNGEWSLFGQIILLLIFTYGSRVSGVYIAGKIDERRIENETRDYFEAKEKYCTSCGNKIIEEAEYCSVCGVKNIHKN